MYKRQVRDGWYTRKHYGWAKIPQKIFITDVYKRQQIISRINGFTYVQTQFDYFTGELKVVREIAYSDGPRAKVKCYGADDVRAVSYTHLDVYKRQVK